MLYVMGGETGPLKIGRAKDPRRRMRTIATGCDRPIRLLATHKVEASLTADAEAIAHASLDKFRAYGEWFHVPLQEAQRAILSAIDAVGRGEKAGKKSVGRKMRYPEKREAAFAEGTLARIQAALIADENQVGFIREAVERELERRGK